MMVAPATGLACSRDETAAAVGRPAIRSGDLQRRLAPEQSDCRRRRAGLRVRAGAQHGQDERRPIPRHARGWTTRQIEQHGLRRIERRSGLSHAAECTGVVNALAGRIILLGGGARRGAVADLDRTQRVRYGNGGRPARTNGCQDLHRQCDQQNRNIRLQPLPHQSPPNQRWDYPAAAAGSRGRSAATAHISLATKRPARSRPAGNAPSGPAQIWHLNTTN